MILTMRFVRLALFCPACFLFAYSGLFPVIVAISSQSALHWAMLVLLRALCICSWTIETRSSKGNATWQQDPIPKIPEKDDLHDVPCTLLWPWSSWAQQSR